MGCFLGCFGGAKERKRRNQRGNRASPRRQKRAVQNVQQENEITAEQSVAEKNLSSLDSGLRGKPEGVEQLDPSPEQRVAFNSNITTEEHASISKSIDFQLQRGINDEQEKADFKSPCEATSNVGSDPPNHGNKSEWVVEHLNASPKKRVTFDSNVTTYEHVSVHESIDFQTEGTANIEKEMKEDSKTSSQSHSISEEDNSVVSSVGSYPPNHRYHNARDSDDETEEYSNSDLDDFDDEDDYEENDEDVDVRIADQDVWSEMILTSSMESRTGNHSPQAVNEEVESRMAIPQFPDNEEFMAFGSKANARERSNYINSVLNPVENTTQWKATKLRGQHLLGPQKENLSANFEPPRISFSSEPTFEHFSSKKRSDQVKNTNQEVAVDASLSNWLASSPETTPPPKKSDVGGLDTIKAGQTMTEGCCTSDRSFEDRPILGALTVDELRHISAASASPRKSPSRCPDEMPIIGTVGTYWNHSNSVNKHSDPSSSFKGIPNTTSKYREDKRVNWHSTPFEKRLDRALLNQHAKLEA